MDEQRQGRTRAFDRDGYLLVPGLLAAVAAVADGRAGLTPIADHPEVLRLVEDLFRDDVGHRAAAVRRAGTARSLAPELPADHNQGFTFARMLVVHSHRGDLGHAAAEVLPWSSDRPVQLEVDAGSALVLHGAVSYRYLCPGPCFWPVVEFFPALRATRFGWPGKIAQGDEE